VAGRSEGTCRAHRRLPGSLLDTQLMALGAEGWAWCWHRIRSITLSGGTTSLVGQTGQRHANTKQSTAIHILLGVAILPAIALFYVLLARHGRSGLSPWGWLLFAAFCLLLIVGAFAPSLARRWRGLPAPGPLSPSEVGAYILVAVASCLLAFYGVSSGMWWMMVLAFMLPSLWFMFRRPRPQRHHYKE
jgi:hypothetical protein